MLKKKKIAQENIVPVKIKWNKNWVKQSKLMWFITFIILLGYILCLV
jgi:hypothetical protein